MKDSSIYQTAYAMKLEAALKRRLATKHDANGEYRAAKAAKEIANRCDFAALPYFSKLDAWHQNDILNNIQDHLDRNPTGTNMEAVLK